LTFDAIIFPITPLNLVFLKVIRRILSHLYAIHSSSINANISNSLFSRFFARAAHFLFKVFIFLRRNYSYLVDDFLIQSLKSLLKTLIL
jgi:hypothetical protein